MLGGLFFQSFYAAYTLTQYGANVELYVNKNALDSTEITSEVRAAGPSPFQVPTAQIKTDPLTEKSGLPTFPATISGITDSEPYFLLDFESDKTVVWSTTCKTTGIGAYPAGDCSENPTLMKMGFDGSPLPTTTGTFTDAQFGGYVVSGTKYTSEICFDGFNCKFIDVYGVD